MGDDFFVAGSVGMLQGFIVLLLEGRGSSGLKEKIGDLVGSGGFRLWGLHVDLGPTIAGKSVVSCRCWRAHEARVRTHAVPFQTRTPRPEFLSAWSFLMPTGFP